MTTVGPVQISEIKRVATNLLGKVGFEWMLCIEPEAHHNSLDEWASKNADRFAYRYRSWKINGTHSAALLRRGKNSPERIPLNEGPKQIVTTSGAVPISANQWATTLETFTKWTVDPRWLIYLPPGMASFQEDTEDGYLEHISDALNYYRGEGIRKVVVEKKHMGSRAIAVVCRDAEAASRRFGCKGSGCIYTRTGRPFFEDSGSTLQALRQALERARFWDRFSTDWVCLDGEMLPWSLKAKKLIDNEHGELLELGEAVLGLLKDRLLPIAPEEGFQLRERSERFAKYRRLHEKYEAERGATPARGARVQFAPFHLVATEGVVHLRRNHHWHMNTLRGVVCRGGAPFIETEFQLVDLEDKKQIGKCVRWWEELSHIGEEGLVVKPLYFIPKGKRGFAQPAIKCRGKEHLRLVYGPDYDLPERRLELLDRRSLERRRQKHRKVLKQLSLSLEAIERFVRREPIDRVEECVRGVLALGSKYDETESFEERP